MRLVQIANGFTRRVALVEEPHLACLSGVESIYELASACIRERVSLSRRVQELTAGETIFYDDIYSRKSEWRLLSPIDVPGAPARVLVSGTGLTHLGSAKNRQAMHVQQATSAEPLTDSMRMFELGVAGGRPKEGEIGAAPEWFYKGHGDALQAPFVPLTVPAHAEDGGEEAEIAGIYLVASDGSPYRLGMCAGNEFSDHSFERRNYLNLAGSKLRQCSIRILCTAKRVISQYLAREFPPLAWFFLDFCERLQWLCLCDENFAQDEMDKGSLRVQVQSFLQLNLGFIVSACHVEPVSQLQPGDGI